MKKKANQTQPMFCVVTLMFFLFCSLSSLTQTTYYVKTTGDDAKDGKSWSNAFRTIQKALSASVNGDQIWVAAGAYYPDEIDETNSDDITASFYLKANVKLYGGFAATENELSQRNWQNNVTILSGDIGQEDNSVTHAKHVVRSLSVEEITVIDGFTVTGGSAGSREYTDVFGGGMLNQFSQVAISNCIFSDNLAYMGGGVANFESVVQLTNCTFNDNRAAPGGGGLYHEDASAVVINCTFSNNSALEGGGMSNSLGSITIRSCRFIGNSGGRSGGGLQNTGSAIIINSIFKGNGAETGGGISLSQGFAGQPADHAVSLINCSFFGNSALTSRGGALNNETVNSPNITNCIFWGNAVEEISQFAFGGSTGAVPTITYSIVKGGYTGTGNLDKDPLFVNAANGDLRLQSCSPAINSATSTGAPADDMDENSRPALGGIDMGAYEYQTGGVGSILFVKANANPVGDGLSWNTAFNKLQDALARSGGCFGNVQIWVAKGTYYPDEGNGYTDNDKTASFYLKNNVAMYGGFAGNETQLSQRNWTNNETILSGDIDQQKADSNLNSIHVVRSQNVNTASVLDGFTVTAGFGNSRGEQSNVYAGGMLNESSSVTISNCKFSYNMGSFGGGMANFSSSAKLTNCTFLRNLAVTGGGLYNEHSSSTDLVACDFLNNRSSGVGGGIGNRGTLNVENCMFIEDTAGAFGGGIANLSSPAMQASAKISNCIFKSNKAKRGGGINCDSPGPSLSVTNCSFFGNSASEHPLVGGGFNNESSNLPTITNCIFWENLPQEIGAWTGEIFLFAPPPVVTYSIVKGGYDGVGNLNKDPLFVDAANGDLRLKSCSPAIDMGNNAAIDLPTDLDGNSRKVNSTNALEAIVDMGAYEFQGTVPAMTITCPSNFKVNTDAGKCSAIVNFTGSKAATSSQCATFTYSPVSGSEFNKGVNTVAVTATDARGNTATCSFTVTIEDKTPPVINNITQSLVVLSPPNHKMRDVTINYTATDACGVTSILQVTSNEPISGTGDGDTAPDWEVLNNRNVKLRAERAGTGDGRIYTIKILATDASGNTSTASVEVRVTHNITSPKSGQPFKVGSTVSFAGEFWDKPGNKHTATWLIDDNTTIKGTVTEPTTLKNGKVTGSYKFGSPGVYKLQMNTKDQNNVTTYANTNGDMEAIVVIYDPNGGYAYGGGYFNSPQGALTSSTSAIGKACYGFSVNYFKGATYPKGETQFEFKVGEFEYNALNFEYMAIAGAKAQMKGTGKMIGGQSGINFILTVTDGQLDGSGVDKIRMKIFNKNTGEIYYDNQPGASDVSNPVMPVQENSTIVISGPATTTPTVSNQTSVMAEKEVTAGTESLQVKTFPNPSHSSFNLSATSSDKEEKIMIQVVDILGRIVETRSMNADQTIQVGEKFRPGVYLVKFIQGRQVRELKLVKSPG